MTMLARRLKNLSFAMDNISILIWQPSPDGGISGRETGAD
jgi:hypothetical protein